MNVYRILLLCCAAFACCAPVLAQPAGDDLETRIRAALSAARLDEADALLTEALGQAPDDASLVNLRGLWHFYRGEYADAEQGFDRAYTLATDSTAFLVNRGWARVRQGRVDEGVADAAEAVARDPESSTAHTAHGYFVAITGDMNAALSALSKAIELDAANADAYYFRGQVFEGKGLNERAVADYSAYLERNPNADFVYAQRALNKARMGDYDAALADYEAALGLNPNNVYTYLGRAAMYEAQGDVEAAVRDFEQALALDPTRQDALSDLGAIYWRQGRLGKALAVADRAIESLPDDAFGYNLRAKVLLARKASEDDFEEASDAAEEAIRRAPDDPEGYANRCAALVYSAVAQNLTAYMHNALADCETALEKDPDYFEAYDHMAVGYLAAGDAAASAEADRKAKEIRARVTGQ